MRDIHLTRTFWSVGHGAFYTEKFGGCENTYKAAVYDCGGMDDKYVNKQVDSFLDYWKRPPIEYLFISHFHHDHICGINRLLPKVRYLVVPYLTEAQYVEAYTYNEILATNKRKKINITASQALIERISGESWSGDNSIVMIDPIKEGQLSEAVFDPMQRIQHLPSGYKLPLKDDSGKDFWVYIPVNVNQDLRKYMTLVTELNKLCSACGVPNVIQNGKIQWQSIKSIVAHRLSAVKRAYEKAFHCGSQHNVYSMPVFSGPIIDALENIIEASCELCYMNYCRYNCMIRNCRSGLPCGEHALGCLYMGDFETDDKDNFSQLTQALGVYYYRAGIQQVPHHFSNLKSHSRLLYSYRLLAFGNIDDHKDVSYCHSVSNEIESVIGNRPIIITEKEDTRCDLWYRFS